jgi:hypothetical protein
MTNLSCIDGRKRGSFKYMYQFTVEILVSTQNRPRGPQHDILKKGHDSARVQRDRGNAQPRDVNDYRFPTSRFKNVSSLYKQECGGFLNPIVCNVFSLSIFSGNLSCISAGGLCTTVSECTWSRRVSDK